MIIGFWSEQSGRGHTTYNMLASAISLSSKVRTDVVITQGKQDYNKLEYAFTPYEESNVLKEDYGYYHYGGLQSVIQKLESGRLDETTYREELIRVNKSNLYYLQTGSFTGEDAVRKDSFFQTYIQFLKESKSIHLIELPSGFQNIPKDMLHHLDGFVINISQDGKGLSRIMQDEWMKKYAYFVIGSYDGDSEFSANNLQRRYGIQNEKLGMLPYSIKFRDAVCQGRCMEFFDRHKDDEREDEDYELMRCMNQISEMLIKGCGIGS